MKEIVKLEAYNIEQLVNLSGVKDENLEVLEDHFQVEISLRGDEMSIVGSQQQIEKTKKVIYSLLKLIVSGVSISRRDVIYAQKLVEKDKLDQLSELYHIKIARTYNGKLIYPKTLGQKSYYYALKNNDVVFGIGPAGTGKTYLAVVQGKVLNSDTFKDKLEKDQKTNIVKISPIGKQAELSYELLEYKDNLSLVKINLKTGRSHQIRVQFSSRNHPLYGDQKYNQNTPKDQIALFAHRLEFIHPTTKEVVKFELPKPNRYPFNIFN